MKRIFQILSLALLVLGYTSCQPDSFRKVYPKGNPVLEATLLTPEVNFGKDSISFAVSISESETPLSTLSIKVLVGINVIANDEVRTPNYEFEKTFTYAVPFGPNMPEGEPVRVYLTATNVEGTTTNMILSECIGHRPEINSLYVMPPTIKYKPLGKGKQMQWQGDSVFAVYDLKYPKSIECLLAVVGTKFGRVDWNYPVFGMLNGKLQLITKEQFESGEATSIKLANDNFQTIDTITFNPLTFDLYFGGSVAQPVSELDVLTDLADSGKGFHYAKVFFDPALDVTVTGTTDLSKAYNMDFMELLDGGKVKFLAEKGMYDVYYFPEQDYIVVEPFADLVYPNVMWVTGVNFGHPTAEATATAGWGFDKPGQYMACRTVAPKVYQFTAYFKNEQSTDFADYGTVNFKFFHQKGWGGEEAGSGYTQEGLNIEGIGPDGVTKLNGDTGCEKGNWLATNTPFEGVYRVTLDQNKMTTTYEKIR